MNFLSKSYSVALYKIILNVVINDIVTPNKCLVIVISQVDTVPVQALFNKKNTYVLQNVT